MKFFEERKITVKADVGEKLDLMDVKKVIKNKFPGADKITVKRISWGTVFVATIMNELFTTKNKKSLLGDKFGK